MTTSLWFFNVLRFYTEEVSKLLQRRRRLAIDKLENGVDMSLFRNAVILPSRLIPLVMFILVMDDRVPGFDFTTELFKTVNQIISKAEGVATQHSSILWI